MALSSRLEHEILQRVNMYLLRVFFLFLTAGICYGEYCQRSGDCQLTTCTGHGHISCFDNNCVCLMVQDPCTYNPCPAGYTCTATGYNTRQCHCGTTATCHNEHMCNSRPCHNNGICHQTTHQPYYTCSCNFGWTGQNCTETHCASNPCRNGGSCVRLPDAPYFHCSCPHNYNGIRCEHQICKSSSCHNRGTCTPNAQTGHLTCSCNPGYSGTTCQVHNTVHVTTTRPTPASVHQTTTPASVHQPTTPASVHLTTTHTTGTNHPPRLHMTDVPRDPKYGPYCLTCDDVVSPNTCEYVARCGPHEICSVDSFVTSSGIIRYNLGCKDSEQCQSTKRTVNSGESEDASTITVCSECCKEHLCNSGGCGITGYTHMTFADRGPVCFHCNQENSPAECSKLAVCGRDEVCAVAHTQVATTQQTIWKSWCIHVSECVSDIQRYQNTTGVEEFDAAHKYAGLRAGGRCWFMCCVDDLCNRQCPDTTAALYTNLIG